MLIVIYIITFHQWKMFSTVKSYTLFKLCESHLWQNNLKFSYYLIPKFNIYLDEWNKLNSYNTMSNINTSFHYNISLNYPIVLNSPIIHLVGFSNFLVFIHCPDYSNYYTSLTSLVVYPLHGVQSCPISLNSSIIYKKGIASCLF